jgi:hypothetical protein
MSRRQCIASRKGVYDGNHRCPCDVRRIARSPGRQYGCAAAAAFRLSSSQQERLDILLEKNRESTLTAEETVELDTFERFEHLVRLLKARVLQKQGT